MVIKTEYIDEFTNDINNIDPIIKFTSEGEDNDQLPFLDTLVCRLDDGTIKVKVYRKPTHTEQYLFLKSFMKLLAQTVTLFT